MLMADKTGDETNYLYGKALENARRIALILAVSRAPDRFRAKIERSDAEYACGLVGFLIGLVINEVRESLSENTDEKAKKRIRKIVSNAGYEGITRNDLTRKTQFIRRSMRDEYIEDLLDSGEIVMREVVSGRNHMQVYFLAELAPKET